MRKTGFPRAITMFIVPVLYSLTIFSQNRLISGVVSDQSGAALVGATVSVKGGKTTVITDNYEKGKYTEIGFDYSETAKTLTIKDRKGGNIGFRYDLNPNLNSGSQLNLLAVKADNSRQSNSRWYSGSGIYHKKWLQVSNLLQRLPYRLTAVS